MRWIAIAVCLLVLTGSVRAAGSDEAYLNIYNEILQADGLLEGGHSEQAAQQYLQAQGDLQKLHQDHPSWNPDIVQYRLDYLADKLQSLAQYLPNANTNTPPAAATAPAAPNAPATAPVAPAAPAVQAPAAPPPEIADLMQQNAALKEQVRTLTDANGELQSKLKEALSVQPAAVSPDELAKAQEKITMLEKERDLLTVALAQEKAANASAVAAAKSAAVNDEIAAVNARAAAEIAKYKDEADRAKQAELEAEKQLAAANQQLEAMKAAQSATADENAALRARAEADEKQAGEQAAQLKEAAAQSEKMLDALNRELELVKAAQPPNVQIAPGAQQIPEERDQLKQQTDQITKDEADIAALKEQLADGQQKLAAADAELESLKAAKPVASEPSDETKAISDERDKLKAELAGRTKDLADAEAHRNQELTDLRAQLQQATDQRDDLDKKLQAALQQASAKPVEAPDNSALTRQTQQLEARIAVLEANPVPYTAEEQEALKKAPPPAPESAPATTPPPMQTNALSSADAQAATNAPVARHVYSIQDLPPGSGALWADAVRASMAHDYAAAEEKFGEVLQQDQKNVYVLDHLAEAQFANDHLADAEATIHRTLTLDPDDAASLYLLGLLRYRQNKMDDALDALSLSARFNPTNSSTENFLGCVLAEKGLRAASETALRKSLELDPDNADAHFNLSIVYAGNRPPSIELARWHYKRALALGHGRSSTMDSVLQMSP
jgi:hypothetical protein